MSSTSLLSHQPSPRSVVPQAPGLSAPANLLPAWSLVARDLQSRKTHSDTQSRHPSAARQLDDNMSPRQRPTPLRLPDLLLRRTPGYHRIATSVQLNV